MRPFTAGRLVMVLVVLLVLAAFWAAARAAGGINAAQGVLAATSCVFAYVVVRLSQAMFAASADRRRRARRGLLLAAAVPALVLTPSALGVTPVEYAPLILLGAVVWIALAMSYTSFVLHRATVGRTNRKTAHARVGGKKLHLNAAARVR